MKRPTDKALLDAWEQGLNRPLIYGNLLLLGLQYPNASMDDLLDFSIGERDTALLYLRQLLFGNRLDNTANCPSCEEKVEWEAKVSDFQLQRLKLDFEPILYHYDFKDQSIQFRLPNSRDILELANQSSKALPETLLLQYCIQDEVNVAQLSEEVKEGIVQKMAALDPQADIRLQISCPECGHAWELALDILSYLWEEVNEWADGMIQEIGLLAKHFSWSESDILNMSHFRRNRYLKLIGQ